MKNLLFISIFLSLFLRINPVSSLEDREVLFKDALSASSIGQFVISLDKWNQYLEEFPDELKLLLPVTDLLTKLQPISEKSYNEVLDEFGFNF